MRYLIADTYYPSFLSAFYARHPAALRADYDDALHELLAQSFGTADFYSRNLRALGFEAVDVVANDEVLQEKWLGEHSLERSSRRTIRSRLASFARAQHPNAARDWPVRPEALVPHVRQHRPAVLYMQNLSLCEPAVIHELRDCVGLIVGQIASPPPERRYLEGCDLILTSFPHYVERFRAMGIDSEYFRIGFEPTVLERLTPAPERYDAVFVGAFEDVHAEGTMLLEKVASEVGLDVWGYGVENLGPDSPLRRTYHGEAWGLDMYNVFAGSRIVINRHSSASENYANNMRLYEATGVGAFLITDHKDNLGELFEVGTEIESYRDADELVEKVRYYLDHDEERLRIARAGQARTLRDHTYLQRMKELEEIVGPRLKPVAS
jgi:spore maturation protein CgeB